MVVLLHSESDFAALAQIGEHDVDAHLVDRPQRSVGDAQAHPTPLALDPEPAVLQVGHEAALGLVIGVRDVMADHRRLAGDLTYTCHSGSPGSGRCSAKPRILRETDPGGQTGAAAAPRAGRARRTRRYGLDRQR